MIICGASSYSRDWDYKKIREIADEIGAFLLADIAHPSGLISRGLLNDPLNYCHVVTSTTHKTLRGPRGGLILCKEEHGKAIDSAVFPGNQGGPLMHVIAAKAVCFGEAAKPDFIEYQNQVKQNAKRLSSSLVSNGFHLVSGGTDNHLMLMDLRPSHPDLTGKQGQLALEKANVTLNRNTVPGETRSPFQTSGLRIGTPAVSSRGMKETEMDTIASIISSVLSNIENDPIIMEAREKSLALCAQFPLPY